MFIRIVLGELRLFYLPFEVGAMRYTLRTNTHTIFETKLTDKKYSLTFEDYMKAEQIDYLSVLHIYVFQAGRRFESI